MLIDELAHTNIPGSKHAKRWQDIEEILDVGITVITNLNIQHLESLNDVVRQITGAARIADRSKGADLLAVHVTRADPAVSWTPAEHAELTATVRESLGQLTSLVDNLLDMSRLQAGTLGVRIQPVTVADISSRVLDGLGAQARQVKVSLPGDLLPLLADPALLERVLANLLGNAVRYSPLGRPVLLTASSHHGQVELRVADRGPGIPAADRDRAFQRLSAQDAHPGPGLDLALASRFTTAMNGTLTPDDTRRRAHHDPRPTRGTPGCGPRGHRRRGNSRFPPGS